MITVIRNDDHFKDISKQIPLKNYSFFLDKQQSANPGDSLSYIYEAVLADGELNSPCIYSKPVLFRKLDLFSYILSDMECNKLTIPQHAVVQRNVPYSQTSIHTSLPTHSGAEYEKGRGLNRDILFPFISEQRKKEDMQSFPFLFPG